MRPNRTTSLIMAFLVLGASFMTLCPASESADSEVHFIAETCDSHDCNRNDNAQSHTEENCQHQFCSDQSITSCFLLSHANQFVVVVPHPLSIIDIFFSPTFQTISLPPLLDPPPIAAQRMAILRI